MHRRHFLRSTAALGGLALTPNALFADHHEKGEALFDISLAEWSLHRALKAKKISNIDFPRIAKVDYGIHAVEYVNAFFKDKAENKDYLGELKLTCDDLGVKSLLIMIDGEGHLGAGTDQGRQKTVDQHKKWVTAAKFLGCHSIRVNSHGEGADDDAKAANCIKGLRALSTFAKDHEINVIVENHGGLSSNGTWMAKVLKEVGMDNCGSLPDFGNFHGYDRYQGIKDLMPFAKGVSAKAHEFDKDGNETKTDFKKAIKLVLDAGYHGHIGIEYEGRTLSEPEGIKATKRLLERVRGELAKEAQ
jgi:L-ribulose-5-phosphate 3-epimerase